MLVKGHCDAVAGTAHRDAGVTFAGFHSLGAWVGKIGIVATVAAESAVVLELAVVWIEISLDD